MIASKTGSWAKWVLTATFLPVALAFAFPSTLSGQGGVDIRISVPEPSASVVPAGAKLWVGYRSENLTELPHSNSIFFKLSIYLSNDAQISTDDSRLGSSRTGLAFLQSFSGRVIIEIPGDTAPGTYFLGMCATEIQSPDINPSNNCTNPGASIEIVDADAAELEILYGGIRFGSTKTNPGETLETILKVQNHGTVSAGSFAVEMIWRRILRGHPGDREPKLQSLAKVDGGIAPGEFVYADIAVAIPDDATPGQYALTFCIDSANEIPERDETNNCRRSPYDIVIDGPHDFRITEFDAHSPSGYSPWTITFSYTLVNNPHAPDYPLPKISAFYSLDPVIGPDDPEFDTFAERVQPYFWDHFDPVFSLSPYNLYFPSSIAPGLYYFGVCVDWLNFIEEENEENNCSPTVPFTVPALPIAPPSRGLEIEAWGMGRVREAGETVNVWAIVRNNASYVLPPVRLGGYIQHGWGGCPGDAGTRIHRPPPYYEPDFTLESSEELPPHAVQKITGSFVVPERPSGGRYLFSSMSLCGGTVSVRNAATDYRAAWLVFVIKNKMPVPPDLSAGLGFERLYYESYSNKGLIVRGVPFEMTVTTSNNTQGLISTPTTTSVRLSTDATIDASDLELYRTIVSSVWPDQDRAKTIVYTLPDNVGPGEYFIGACPDFYDELEETVEIGCGTGVFPQPVTVIDPPPALIDLAVTDVRVDSSAAGYGEPITLGFSLMNRGTQAAAPHDYNHLNELKGFGQLQVSILWAETSSIDTTGTFEGRGYGVKTTGTLGAGESRAFTVSLPAPNNFMTGLHFLGVCVLVAEFEFNWHNNCEDVAVWLEAPLRFDFQVADYTVQFPDTPSVPTEVSFRAVESEGYVPRGRHLYATVLWSADRRIDEDDQVVGATRLGGLGREPDFVTGPMLVDLPEQAWRGGSYIAICLNHGLYRRFVEMDEENNCATIPVPIDGETAPGVSELAFNLAGGGASSWLSSSDSGSLVSGYARIQPEGGSTTPFGVAIFGYRENGILISEAGVPATRLISGGRIYAEVGGP